VQKKNKGSSEMSIGTSPQNAGVQQTEQAIGSGGMQYLSQNTLSVKLQHGDNSHKNSNSPLRNAGSNLMGFKETVLN
jgi:hypothetical protein